MPIFNMPHIPLSSQQREKRDKKTKRVPRPAAPGQHLPSDDTPGHPVTQVRTNSLPDGQPEDRRRSQNLDAVFAPEGAVGLGAEDGAVGGAINGVDAAVMERRDKPPKTTPMVRER